MRQYEKNINKVMPIYRFGKLHNVKIKYCILKQITNMDGMCYFLELLDKDRKIVGKRWITRDMYRYHVMQKHIKTPTKKRL